MDMILWVLKLLIAVLSLQYIVGPFLVLWFQKYPESFRFRLIDSEKFMGEQSSTFRELQNEVVKSGFEYAGSSELVFSHSSMDFSIYNNHEKKLICTLSSIQSQPINSTQIEFTKIYNDGSVLNVGNCPVFSTYPGNDRKISFRFPDINDVDQLLGVAQRLAGSNVNTVGELAIERGLEFETLESNLNEELGFLMSKGWVSKKSVGDKRSLTLKGALLMTWQLCWPVKLFLNNRDVKSSMRALDNA